VGISRLVACVAVAAGVMLAAGAPAGQARDAAPVATPAVWCISHYFGPALEHRFVVRRRPSSCILEILAHRGDIAALNPVCCITDVFGLHWSSWTRTRAVGFGGFAPSVSAQGTRDHARVVLDLPEPGCLDGAPAPVVFTRARIYPGIGGTEYYEQNLPHNDCVV
jgi:hypothetical protein